MLSIKLLYEIFFMTKEETFFSNNAAVSKKFFMENQEKLNYQRKLIGDIERKHKEWSKEHK